MTFVQLWLDTICANVGVFVAACFFWGVPAVILLSDESVAGSDLESLVGPFLIVALGLLFFSIVLFLQLLLFSVLVSIVRSRLLAIASAPVAVGMLFGFAESGFGPTLFLAGLTLSFGCSAYVSGSPAWWQKKPRRILWAAAVFTIVFVAIAVSQILASSERTRSVFEPMLTTGPHSALESGEWWPQQGYASRSSERRSRQAVPRQA